MNEVSLRDREGHNPIDIRREAWELHEKGAELTGRDVARTLGILQRRIREARYALVLEPVESMEPAVPNRPCGCMVGWNVGCAVSFDSIYLRIEENAERVAKAWGTSVTYVGGESDEHFACYPEHVWMVQMPDDLIWATAMFDGGFIGELIADATEAMRRDAADKAVL